MIKVLCLFLLASFFIPVAYAADETPAVEDPERNFLVKQKHENMDITAQFRLGKAWDEDLKKFPSVDDRLLIIDVILTNSGEKPFFLYLEQIWLHLDEEDQEVDVLHAEDIGPRVYKDPYTEEGRMGKDLSGPVSVIGTPGTQEGQTYDPRSQVGGVFIDFKKMKNNGAPPLSMEKFVFTLFEKEFSQTYLKPGETASGYLYFHLPWSYRKLTGMQLHLVDIFGEPVDIVLAVPGQKSTKPTTPTGR